MTNDPKDRHVLAAAIRGGAHAIITDNTRHFPAESLQPYGIEVQTTDDFLRSQYNLGPDLFSPRRQASLFRSCCSCWRNGRRVCEN